MAFACVVPADRFLGSRLALLGRGFQAIGTLRAPTRRGCATGPEIMHGRAGRRPESRIPAGVRTLVQIAARGRRS